MSYSYKLDPQHPYRFHSPNANISAISYIDLLADPVGPESSSHHARAAMGAGEQFGLKAFAFARKAAFEIFPRAIFPNPIGFFALKRESYLDEPVRRTKDLADIAEVASGLVEAGIHFEIDEIWSQVEDYPDAQEVRSMLLELGKGQSVQWDLENVTVELSHRGFNEAEINDIIPRRLIEIAEVLGS